MSKTSWKSVYLYLSQARREIVPFESTESAFFLLEISKMLDFVQTKISSDKS